MFTSDCQVPTLDSRDLEYARLAARLGNPPGRPRKRLRIERRTVLGSDSPVARRIHFAFVSGRLGEAGVYAQSVPHIGLCAQSDPVIWRHALDQDFAVVTTNARDFIKLLDVELHPGLVVLRESGLTREEQWRRILLVVEHIKASGDPDFMLNKLLEIFGP